MRSSTRMSLAATLAIVAGLGVAQEAMPAPRKGSGRAHKPTPPRMDTELAREIAEHNRAVEYRKAEKKAAKLARRVA